MTASADAAPAAWPARFFEDIAVGAVYTSRFGRTVTEADNVWFNAERILLGLPRSC